MCDVFQIQDNLIKEVLKRMPQLTAINFYHEDFRQATWPANRQRFFYRLSATDNSVTEVQDWSMRVTVQVHCECVTVWYSLHWVMYQISFHYQNDMIFLLSETLADHMRRHLCLWYVWYGYYQTHANNCYMPTRAAISTYFHYSLKEYFSVFHHVLCW